MTNAPLLTVLWVLPVLAAVIVATLPATARTAAKYLGVAAATATLAVAILLAARFDPAGERFQFVESHPWIRSFGVGYTLGVDG
ncbi:MAG TPA: NADH-quinone oxidoreductase subunit M, partial [Mycobacterium sp.]|nr:NADH-quinone oxidoreductase subunit M [Mycobacterium sp.]